MPRKKVTKKTNTKDQSLKKRVTAQVILSTPEVRAAMVKEEFRIAGANIQIGDVVYRKGDKVSLSQIPVEMLKYLK